MHHCHDNPDTGFDQRCHAELTEVRLHRQMRLAFSLDQALPLVELLVCGKRDKHHSFVQHDPKDMGELCYLGHDKSGSQDFHRLGGELPWAQYPDWAWEQLALGRACSALARSSQQI